MSDVIRNCSVKYRCPLLWDALEKTSNSDVKFCPECKRTVHYCHTPEDLFEAMRENHCVAITLIRDSQEPIEMMGDISPPVERY